MELIDKYFPHLSDDQRRQYDALDGLYREWNEKINVISRRDIDNLALHHVLHSLAIACLIRFRPGTSIIDLGTGGGFPGIPLAIMFPDCHFRLIDGTGKKIRVVEEVVKALGLKNVDAEHLRGEDERGEYDFVVSRAALSLPDLARLMRKNVSPRSQNALPNGIICLKGGDLNEELKPFRNAAEVTPISTYFSEEWFQEKSIIYLPIRK